MPLRNDDPARSNFGFILAVCVLAGLVATYLNHLLYETQSPFFDSLSYYEKLHRVMSYTRSGGFSEGLRETLHGANTVCLPFLIAIPLSYILTPCREIGIWIQVAELFLFLWSLDVYFRRFVRASGGSRIAVTLGFFTLACLYFQNGGLSDFRMDLSLMLLYGLSAVWLLAALQDQSPGSFGKLGLTLAATCLFRATAPVYFAVSFGPIVLVHLWQIRTSPITFKRSVRGLLLAGLTSFGLAGWYFIVNFEYLYYYYFVWNTDANARLPWSQAVQHLDLVKRAIGEPALASFSAIAFLALWRIKQAKPSPSQNRFLGGLDWRMIWIAAAPTLLLIAKRAGLNPFVSFPTAIGVFLAAANLALNWNHRLTVRDRRFVCALILFALVLAGGRAWKKHRFTDEGSMAAHRAIHRQIVEDARIRNLKQLHFETLQTTELCTSSLWSALLFDTPHAQIQNHQVRLNGIQLMPSRVFFLPAVSDWKGVEGDSDAAKVHTLTLEANGSIDYLVIPEPESLINIQEELYAPVINQHVPELRSSLLDTGQWQPLSPNIPDVPGRVYRVYRNLERTSGK